LPHEPVQLSDLGAAASNRGQPGVSRALLALLFLHEVISRLALQPLRPNYTVSRTGFFQARSTSPPGSMLMVFSAASRDCLLQSSGLPVSAVDAASL